MTEPDVRRGMPAVKLSREEFENRFRSRFRDPAFTPLGDEPNTIMAAAWDAYSNSRKAPRTQKAGASFADPDYDIASDWLAVNKAILEAQRRSRPAAKDTSGQRLTAERAYLSWRDVQDVASGAASRGRFRLNGISVRLPRPFADYVGVRQDHSSLQSLRRNLNGSLPLAL
jgi:hypothetical protein